MTKEEAIECLAFQNEKFFGGQSEALNMAISALSENKGESRPKAEWDVNCQGIVFCSKCKKVINHNYDVDYVEKSLNFCPNCGADMRK